eukprot:TRINITY_DN10215_c0_g1_i3.p1 TRINITY_DN10215_c0_g1~~TRINITY_DN10215_c0_g1_i3.p1  ORF type:complete len:150 (-),score=31.84 TRINITY_DN10215_c0_g1_i3:36-485(-)
MISNKLACMMGSKQGMRVSSRYQYGSEFSFEIPQTKYYDEPFVEEVCIEIDSNSPQPNEIPILEPCDCRMILSVEDNDYSQMVITRMMKKFGFEVTKAFNGEEAINILKEASQMGEKRCMNCLLYTSDAADDLLCVDLGGRRIIKKKKE